VSTSGRDWVSAFSSIQFAGSLRVVADHKHARIPTPWNIGAG
jgi:hypothetical protein